MNAPFTSVSHCYELNQVSLPGACALYVMACRTRTTVSTNTAAFERYSRPPWSAHSLNTHDEIHSIERVEQIFLAKTWPGLITGAADDDPSGIATYSQVGAGFGYGVLWTTFFTFPLMVGIQIVSARIGRVTGHGLATNISKHYPAWLLYSIVGLLLVANTINIAADLGAMGAALKLLIGSPRLYATLFLPVVADIAGIRAFPRYAPTLKYSPWHCWPTSPPYLSSMCRGP